MTNGGYVVNGSENWHCVYILINRSNDTVKIGHFKIGVLSSRLEMFRNANSAQVEFGAIYVFRTQDHEDTKSCACSVERGLHNKFKKFRVRREWFSGIDHIFNELFLEIPFNGSVSIGMVVHTDEYGNRLDV